MSLSLSSAKNSRNRDIVRFSFSILRRLDLERSTDHNNNLIKKVTQEILKVENKIICILSESATVASKL